mgnify:CR=1 FL=1
MKSRAEVVSGDGGALSLVRLLPEGVTIVDVVGYVAKLQGTLVFKLCYFTLSNNERIYVEGEHDCAYLDGANAALSEAQLKVLE